MISCMHLLGKISFNFYVRYALKMWKPIIYPEDGSSQLIWFANVKGHIRIDTSSLMTL